VAENALVPELAVSDWTVSRAFYTGLIGFDVLYERPEEGFSYLTLGAAQLMIDQIGLGRTFDIVDAPLQKPFGRGLNLQIRVPDVSRILARLAMEDVPLYLPLEEKWYRRDDHEVGNRQFVVADPDGYLLRLFEDLGERPLSAPRNCDAICPSPRLQSLAG
jgi:catechol 2,3-dioxygenase-like lactoylglutathione lyase family enzyme